MREIAFPSLAVELVELVAGHLDSGSLLNLRLVCWDLHDKTFHHFAQRSFASVKSNLSEESLARINALAQHQALRPYVRGLAFVLQDGVGRGLKLDRHPWGELCNILQVKPIKRLQDNLIKNLTNCRSFFIFCRYPEGQGPDMTHVTITDAVAIFFAFVVDNTPFHIESFHLIYANRHSRTLIMDMRRLPKLLYRQPQFKRSWSSLQKLSLEQYLTLDNFGFLLELVLSAPNLHTLLLNIGSHDLACEFMHELAETAVFSQLHEFALFRTSVRAPDLLKLLGDIRPSLNSLTFYHVSLAHDDSWNSVLGELNQGFTSLCSLSLYYLWAVAQTPEVLSFPDLQKTPMFCDVPNQGLRMFYSETSTSPSILGIEYSGSKMSQVLGLLQDTTG
ncbi:hypothetical protein N7495_009996 [Penicillium taxi]|uniref:uncharacterized protein n=1 Tax=Penicillium taxi TaxID=168475 RepID=UPI0025459E15|nr:uncharacterized protein N7495_009996 [Penicillium taxi]KAJ5885486.1 hypothetical protein N7495_009996 [Penicillium taxi]